MAQKQLSQYAEEGTTRFQKKSEIPFGLATKQKRLPVRKIAVSHQKAFDTNQRNILMPLFTLPDGPDALLSIHLEKDERLVIAPGSLLAMSDGLSLRRETAGGLLHTLTRAMLRGISSQQQFVEAAGGAGEVLLAPAFPGEIRIFDSNEASFAFPAHAFLAASSDLCLKKADCRFLNRGNSPVLETSGTGILAISGIGSIHELRLEEQTMLVNSHQLVAWESRLVFERVSSARHLLFGRQGKIQEPLLRVRGTGALYLCSRRLDGILHAVLLRLPPGMRGARFMRG